MIFVRIKINHSSGIIQTISDGFFMSQFSISHGRSKLISTQRAKPRQKLFPFIFSRSILEYGYLTGISQLNS